MTTTGTAVRRGRLPASWLIVLITAVAVVATLVVFEADLRQTNRALEDGVDQIGQVVAVNNASLAAAATVTPARAALARTNPPLDSVTGSLQTSVTALGDLNVQLDRLAALLGTTDAPLARAIAASRNANDTVGQAGAAAARLCVLVAQADRLTVTLGSSLNQTATRAGQIDPKLRPLRLLNVLSPLLNVLAALESLLPAPPPK